MGHHDHHSDSDSHDNKDMSENNNYSKRYSGDSSGPPTQNNLKKQSQRTTAIALSILFVVTIGLIAFETWSNSDEEPENRTVKGSKSLMILSHEREKEGAGLIALSTPSRSNSEMSELEALSETNTLQSNKIKALKRQLVDANQKLHEVKAHLFTKGDPSDRSRLAEICQDLVEKDREAGEYKEKVEQLEKDKQEAYQKIVRMESTIDALAAMTDSQRATKDQAIITFQEQIEQLQNLAKGERDELLESIARLEQSHHEHRDNLTDKMDIIKNLENEVTWQYNLLAEKDKEILALSELYKNSEATMNKQLHDLIAAMELEQLNNHNLTSEVNVAQARHSAQLHYTKSLEDRIVQADEKAKQIYGQFEDNIHALVKEYQNANGLLDVYAHSHNQLNTSNKKLAAMVRDEKNKANNLHAKLTDALSNHDASQQRNICLEQELHTTAQNLATLNEQLETQSGLLDNKQQEFDTLAYTHTSLRDQLNERIAQLNANLLQEQQNIIERDDIINALSIDLELEKTRSQELSHMLKTTITDSKDEHKKNELLEEELSRKTEIIAAMEGRLQDKQREISDLSKQVGTLSTDNSQEQLRTYELHRALVTALQENENELLEMKQLSQKFDSQTDTVSILQDRLSQKTNTLDQLQDKLSKIDDELEEQKGLNEELQSSLAIALAHRDAEHEITGNLETEIQNNSKKLVLLQDSLSDKHHEIRTLLEQIQAMNQDLDQERNRSKTLQNSLETALAKHDTEFRTARGMEASLKDNEQQIQSLLAQMDQMANKHNAEQMRSRDLEQSLVSALAKHDDTLDRAKDLEHSLLDNNKKISSYQDSLQEQEQIISKLQEQIQDLNNDLTMEQNRSHAFKHSTEKETMQRFELEQSLADAKNTIDELRSSMSAKSNDNQALQNKILALASELEQEINRSVQLHSHMETGMAENSNLRDQTQQLEQQLKELNAMIKQKEESLHIVGQHKEQALRDKSDFESQLGILQSDKMELEKKYINQLNLVLKQQELVNQLSNELMAEKQRNRQPDSQNLSAEESEDQR